jgi:anthranilate synthase/aminodeoxychorismate synthase-like glutamine amidotransferase
MYVRYRCGVHVLIIDNYDSFTFNLVQRIGELIPDAVIDVVRNDKIEPSDVVARRPSHIILSPGPCTPRESGVCPDIIRQCAGRIPILGVCLGHQTIGDVFGMTVKRHDRLMHGKTSAIHHDGQGIFTNIPNPTTATRYHSLIVDPATVTDAFTVSARTAEGEIMGLRWNDPDRTGVTLEGVQFHPESFLTVDGPHILANFLGIPFTPTDVAASALLET